MENIPCNKKEKNILSREKKSNFRKKDFGLWFSENGIPDVFVRRAEICQ